MFKGLMKDASSGQAGDGGPSAEFHTSERDASTLLNCLHNVSYAYARCCLLNTDPWWWIVASVLPAYRCPGLWYVPILRLAKLEFSGQANAWGGTCTKSCHVMCQLVSEVLAPVQSVPLLCRLEAL
jgi:hypothetical protein